MEIRLKRITDERWYSLEDLPNEEWRDMSYSPYYKISNYGRVKSIERIIVRSDGYTKSINERILRPNIGTSGYLYVNCSKKGKNKTIYIHQAVALAFIGEPNGMDVDHINSIKTDNRLENLRYLSHFENSSRANTGRHKNNSMEKNPRAKHVIGYLDNKEVEHFDCAKKLTKKYGVHYSSLRRYLQNGGLTINGIFYCYGT